MIELMKQYNTDTAQHSKVYDYVVRVGEVPDSYTSSWVQEFVDAANVAYDLATAAGATGGYYGVAVSTYGVHIVYYSAKVEAQTFDFEPTFSTAQRRNTEHSRPTLKQSLPICWKMRWMR